MSTKNKTLKLILNRLKPFVSANNMAGIESVFDEFSIEVILRKDFINFCRNRNESSLVIFICSLYLQNIKNDLEISKILNCYQKIQSGKISSLTNNSKNDTYLNLVCNEIIDQPLCNTYYDINATSLDLLISIELALDFDKPKMALIILNNNFNKINKNNGLLQLALYLCNRNSCITPDRHTNWLDIINSSISTSIPIILVRNKCDIPFKQPVVDLKSAYTKSFDISVKKNDGVKEVFDFILDLTTK